MPSQRYTGANPPIDILRQFPNWEYALDEESIEGQDETTIRPASQQDFLSDGLAFTAGRVSFSDGRQFDAFLELEDGAITGLTTFDGSQWTWSVRKLGEPSRWQAISFDWLPPEERPPTVSLKDGDIFPLEVVTILPGNPGGPAIRVTIPRASADAA